MMENGKVNTELLTRLNLLTKTRIVEAVDLFIFQPTDAKKDFDIAGKTSF